MSCRVAITGIGMITPQGKTTRQTWSRCLQAGDVEQPIPQSWRSYADFTSTIWAPLPEIDFSDYNITRIEVMQQGPASLLMLAAVQEALQQARLSLSIRNAKKGLYSLEGINDLRTGVYAGTGIGNIASFIENQAYHSLAKVKETLTRLESGLAGIPSAQTVTASIPDIINSLAVPFRFNPFAVSIIMPNACSSVCGIKYGIRGHNQTYTGACAAGTIAIGNAFNAIRNGTIDVALAGGVEYLSDRYGGLFKGFDIAKTLVASCDNPTAANRPFDADRSGFLFSQGGTAMLVLENLEHARRRDAKPIAEITGFAESFDAHNIMVMEPSGESMSRMIGAALHQAGIDPQDIDYINAHATGTQVNDETESALIERMFGNRPLVNSTKSLIGHTLGAGGAIETAITALSLQDQTTHICKNLHSPIRDLNFVTDSKSYEMAHALNQSFAFGGHNAALVLKRFSA
ncbi:MAG: hypothetical protein GF398_04085 [Chitinivibrionales bacterium]|nr:hypothetical protein [Chitinivibrionales bacterium]